MSHIHDTLAERIRTFEDAATLRGLDVQLQAADAARPRSRAFIEKAVLATAILAAGAFSAHRIFGTEPASVPDRTALACAAETSDAKSSARLEPLTSVELRERLNYVRVRFEGVERVTPDAASRILLARQAAFQAGLDDVGLDWKFLYGLIHAETSWVARRGASANGTPNLGLAQFEPNTARKMALDNPNDPVEAVLAAARLVRQAGAWSLKRLQDAGLSPNTAKGARALREGVSVYYNTRWDTRHAWTHGKNDQLPPATLQHIANAREGEAIARELQAALRRGVGDALQAAEYRVLYDQQTAAGKKESTVASANCTPSEQRVAAAQRARDLLAGVKSTRPRPA